ncbi:uncharacterized protein V1510DRAFT_408756 [Dipodascopsis tothii]|uniref:uncharacterized protein n=1 Tax=Dipodascopsis tothii TaxID=44089 RepID=UPI0034CDC13F
MARKTGLFARPQSVFIDGRTADRFGRDSRDSRADDLPLTAAQLSALQPRPQTHTRRTSLFTRSASFASTAPSLASDRSSSSISTLGGSSPDAPSPPTPTDEVPPSPERARDLLARVRVSLAGRRRTLWPQPSKANLLDDARARSLPSSPLSPSSFAAFMVAEPICEEAALVSAPATPLPSPVADRPTLHSKASFLSTTSSSSTLASVARDHPRMPSLGIFGRKRKDKDPSPRSVSTPAVARAPPSPLSPIGRPSITIVPGSPGLRAPTISSPVSQKSAADTEVSYVAQSGKENASAIMSLSERADLQPLSPVRVQDLDPIGAAPASPVGSLHGGFSAPRRPAHAQTDSVLFDRTNRENNAGESKRGNRTSMYLRRSKAGPGTMKPRALVGYFRHSRAVPAAACDTFGMTLKDATAATQVSTSVGDDLWVPALVTKCLAFLDVHGVVEEGIYRISGSVLSVEKLRSDFALYGHDLELDVEEHNVHSVASLLKAYIRSLPEELVPACPELAQILTYRQRDMPRRKIQALLLALPPHNFHLLRLLCQHFASVERAQMRNRMTLSNLALILCPTLRMDSKLFTWLVGQYDACWEFGTAPPSIFVHENSSVSSVGSYTLDRDDRVDTFYAERANRRSTIIQHLPSHGSLRLASRPTSVSAPPTPTVPDVARTAC